MTIEDSLALEDAQLARDIHTGQPVGIMLVDPTAPADDPNAYREITADEARAIARRLNELADEVERYVVRELRRASSVDDEFHNREGGV